MTERPARVLWLTKGLGLGGAERLLTSSARHFDSRRFAVEVAYVLPHKRAFVPQLEAAGIPTHCLGTPPLGQLAWAPRLRRLVRTRGFDLIHTHAPVPAVVARMGLVPATPALVHTEHNMWDRYHRATYAVNAATYGRNAAVLAVSSGVAESIVRPPWAPWRTLPPVEVLHHGIDPEAVRSGPEARRLARGRLGLGGDELVIGSVANFTPKKDQRTLFQAVRLLVDSRPHLRLLMVGSGPLEDELRRAVAALRLDDHVRFLGSSDDVQGLLPAFDVFALSSLFEGLPIAIMEAMAAGLPCVATAVGGVPEAYTDGQEGFLVPAQDPPALAAALAKLLDDPGLRQDMGRAGEQTATRFSIAAAAGRMAEVYDDVLGRR